MLRVLRNHRRAAWSETTGYEGLHTLPVPLDAGGCPDQALVAAARAAWDEALAMAERHGVRNAQVIGDRADRHDRPGHGLRHDRHRARLRAGQVQEAGRRRLLQDHQPDGADGAGDARATRTSRSRTIGALRRRARHARRRARRSTTRRCAPRASPTRRLAKVEARCRPPSTSSTSSTAFTLGDEFCRGQPGLHRQPSSTIRASTCCGARLLARRRSRPRTYLLRHDDGRGRAASAGRASRGVRLRQPVRPQAASASSRSTATSA